MADSIDHIVPKALAYAGITNGQAAAGAAAWAERHLGLHVQISRGDSDNTALGIAKHAVNNVDVHDIPAAHLFMGLARVVLALDGTLVDPIQAVFFNINVPGVGSAFHAGDVNVYNTSIMTDAYRECSSGLLLAHPDNSTCFMLASGLIVPIGIAWNPTPISLVGVGRGPAVRAGLGFMPLDLAMKRVLRKQYGIYCAAIYHMLEDKSYSLFCTLLGQCIASLCGTLSINAYGAARLLNQAQMPWGKIDNVASQSLFCAINQVNVNISGRLNHIDRASALFLSFVSWMEVKAMDYMVDCNVATTTQSMSQLDRIATNNFVSSVTRNFGISITVGSILPRVAASVAEFDACIGIQSPNGVLVSFTFAEGAPFFTRLAIFNVLSVMARGFGTVTIESLGMRYNNRYSNFGKTMMYLINDATDRIVNPFFFLAGTGENPVVVYTIPIAQILLGHGGMKVTVAEGSSTTWMLLMSHIQQKAITHTRDRTAQFRTKGSMTSEPGFNFGSRTLGIAAPAKQQQQPAADAAGH